MSDDEIIDAVRDADLDWHAGFPVGDGENRSRGRIHVLVRLPGRL